MFWVQVTEKELCTQLSLHNTLEGNGVTEVHHMRNLLINKLIAALELVILQLMAGTVLFVPNLVQKKECMQWFVVGTKQ